MPATRPTATMMTACSGVTSRSPSRCSVGCPLVADAFYLPRDDSGGFVATSSCGGPWDPSVSHGGPPAALLARAVERTGASWPFRVVRLAVEILGPVPLGDIEVG